MNLSWHSAMDRARRAAATSGKRTQVTGYRLGGMWVYGMTYVEKKATTR